MSIRMLLVISALVLLAVDLRYYLKKKINVPMGLLWVVVSILMLLFAALPIWSGVTELRMGIRSIPFIGICEGLLLLIYILTMRVSVLESRNRELAMQVSLLNQENEQILKRLDKLTEGK